MLDRRPNGCGDRGADTESGVDAVCAQTLDVSEEAGDAAGASVRISTGVPCRWGVGDLGEGLVEHGDLSAVVFQD